MVAVAVDHDNLGIAQVVDPPQPVGSQRAAGSPAQDHDPLHKIIWLCDGCPGGEALVLALGDEHPPAATICVAGR
jgi:hypothetical protein